MTIRSYARRCGWRLTTVTASADERSRYVHLKHADRGKLKVRLSDHPSKYPLSILPADSAALDAVITLLRGEGDSSFSHPQPAKRSR